MREVKTALLETARSLPTRQVRAVAYAGESYVLHVLGVAVALAIVAYFYFVGVSIMNVISHREASLESDKLRSQVAALEAEYFTLSRGVSSEVAGTYDLTNTEGVSFIRRSGAVAANNAARGL